MHRSDTAADGTIRRDRTANLPAILFFAVMTVATVVSAESLFERVKHRFRESLDNIGDGSGAKVLFRFFDDAFTPGGFTYAYPEASDVRITEKYARSGEASLLFDLVASAYSGGSVCLYNGTYDLRYARKHGAQLAFWIKGAVGGENVLVALVDEAVSDNKKTVVRLRVDWYGCDSITTDWTPVHIPLLKFEDSGVYWNDVDSVEIESPFDWGKVAEFRIEARKDENRSFRVWVDDIFIVRSR